MSSGLLDSDRSIVSSVSLMLEGSIEISLEEDDDEEEASEGISSSCISAMLLSIEAKVSETFGSQTSISTGLGVEGAVSILYRLIDCVQRVIKGNREGEEGEERMSDRVCGIRMSR